MWENTVCKVFSRECNKYMRTRNRTLHREKAGLEA